MKVHICNFSGGPEKITRKTTYEEVKAAVLVTGRFSCFEASDNRYAASLYTQLCKDPELEVVNLQFPWTSVRRKGAN